MHGQKPPLTPGRIGAILVSLVLLLGLTIWQLGFRELPHSAPGPVAGAKDLIEFTGDTMGTNYVVKLVSTEQQPTPESIQSAIQRELDNVNTKMSTYLDDSELSRFNQWREYEPFSFSEDTFEVFDLAQRVSEQSGGAFDISVGLLVDAWGFGPGGPVDPPSEADLAQIRERTGYELLTLDPVARTVTKTYPRVECDLSAIAKGYAVDRVVLALEDLGLTDYMVEVGGEVRTDGRNAQGNAWQIGIEIPSAESTGVQRVAPLSGMAMATSGDYRNFYERDGVRVSHTIDPRSGQPVRHTAASVTVIHHECALADAYATALMVMGPEEGLALANKQGLPVLYLVHGEDGAIEERGNPAFESFLEMSAGMAR